MKFLTSALSLAFGISTLQAEPAPKEDWTYLDNGKIRIGVNRSAGATLGWLSGDIRVLDAKFTRTFKTKGQFFKAGPVGRAPVRQMFVIVGI